MFNVLYWRNTLFNLNKVGLFVWLYTVVSITTVEYLENCVNHKTSITSLARPIVLVMEF